MLKEWFGCWIHERWRIELVLRCPWVAKLIGLSWLDLCNRAETVEIESTTGGRICRWRDSSSLTAVRLFPQLGPRLLQAAAAEWPFSFDDSTNVRTSEAPEISVLIAFSGRERLPQLLMTLASLRAQLGARFEIIVVETGSERILRNVLPKDVRHIDAPMVSVDQPFNKSWALNIGARAARGKFLAIHDGDYVVPRQYLAKSIDLLREFDGVRPHRFIYYMNETGSQLMINHRGLNSKINVERVVANNPTPIVVRAESYWLVGGHDESFFGWGGEDLEFLSRISTRTFSVGGLMPVIHLWHPPAPKKANGNRNTQTYESIIRVPPEKRIASLVSMDLGGHRPQPSDLRIVEATEVQEGRR